MSVRVNGNGVPRGWKRFAPRGSTYYWDDRHIMLRSNYDSYCWKVVDTYRHDVIAEGRTMAEAAHASGLYRQEVAR